MAAAAAPRPLVVTRGRFVGGSQNLLDANSEAAVQDYRREVTQRGLSREESRFVVLQRVDQIIQQFAWAGCLVVSNYQLLDLCGGNAGTLALHVGYTTTVGNLIQTFVAPISTCLSDAIGRVPVLTAARLGRLVGVLLMPHCTTLRRRFWFEVICGMNTPNSGLVMAGSESVFDAATADIFGSRPNLAAQIDAKSGLYSSFAHTAALAAGSAATSLLGGLHGQWALAQAAAIINVVFSFMCPETLTVGQRKPFKVRTILSDIALSCSSQQSSRGSQFLSVLFASKTDLIVLCLRLCL